MKQVGFENSFSTLTIIWSFAWFCQLRSKCRDSIVVNGACKLGLGCNRRWIHEQRSRIAHGGKLNDVNVERNSIVVQLLRSAGKLSIASASWGQRLKRTETWSPQSLFPNWEFPENLQLHFFTAQNLDNRKFVADSTEARQRWAFFDCKKIAICATKIIHQLVVFFCLRSSINEHQNFKDFLKW